MKRLLKYEWKCYLAAILITSILMIGYQFHNSMFLLSEGNYMERITGVVDSVSYGFFNMINDQCYIVILMLAFLIMKIFQCWNEKNVYGREFIVLLPVKKRTRKGFYVLADSIFVTVSMLIYTVGILIYVTYGLRRIEIEIPWLTKAIVGEMLTSISYMLMLLGIIEFLEILFVDGIMKIVGVIGTLGMSALVLENVFDKFFKWQFVQKIYGFFTLEGAGNQYFEEYTNIFSNGGWMHSITDPPIFFQGQSVKELISVKKWILSDPEFSRAYDFSHISTYAGWAACYLIIGCVMAGIAIWLAGKTDVSKSGFYFGFGRVLFSIVVGTAFLTMCIGAAKTVWYKLLVVVGAIGIIVVLVYMMTPDRKKIFDKEE